jgi:hypothetical protein
VPLEGKFLLIALVMPVQKPVVKLKHFDNVFAKGGNNIVEVFKSLTTSF